MRCFVMFVTAVCVLFLLKRNQLLTWTRDLVMRYWSAEPCDDSCQLIITWTSNIYNNDSTLIFLFWRTDLRTDWLMCERTDSHVTAKYFVIHGLPNFVRYGAPPTRLRYIEAPLLLCVLEANFCIENVLISISHWALSKHSMTCVHFRTRDPNKRLNCLIFRQKI